MEFKCLRLRLMHASFAIILLTHICTVQPAPLFNLLLLTALQMESGDLCIDSLLFIIRSYVILDLCHTLLRTFKFGLILIL